MNLYKDVSEDENNVIAIENLFYMQIEKERGEMIRTLPQFPFFVGVSGGNGRDYSKESKIKLHGCSILCRMNLFNIFYVIYYKKIKKFISHTRKIISRYKTNKT